MASLHDFQAEIDGIHAQEVAKQRARTAVERDKEREPRIALAKKKATTTVNRDVAATVPSRKDEKRSGKAGSKGGVVTSKDKDVKDKASVATDDATSATGSTAKDDEQHEVIDERPNEELEEEIESLILSGNEDARNAISALITRQRGEYIFRIGARPPRTALYANNISDDIEGWYGSARHSQEDIDKIKQGLIYVVEDIGGKASILFETKGAHPRACLLLRLQPVSVMLTPEVRCAVVGNVDSGKSTTLGVLTRGGLDDGRGLARVALFRHKHEIETGRTSSVGMEILGFGPSGAPILPNATSTHDPNVIHREKLSWDEISIQASKIISFIDLAGHERYLKTTLYGLTSAAPSAVILTVGANAGLIGMSKEHLAVTLALGVPVIVCITKIDMAPKEIYDQTLKQVVKILKSPGCRKEPVFVESMEATIDLAINFGKEKVCPIFKISNVTGAGHDYLRTFLNLLPPSDSDGSKFSVDQPLEYSITDIWSVPYVGTVVNGIIHAGILRVGQPVLLGPDANGNFTPTIVRDMQRKKAPVTKAEAGQSVSLALKRIKRAEVRKGMVIVSKSDTPPKAVRQFEGQVLILYHNTTLQKNYQAMLHCGAVRQTVRILDLDHPQGVLRTGDRATVRFEFIARPEFVKEGMKLLFREGKTKGLGVITKLL